MAFTLAYLVSRVPQIPRQASPTQTAAREAGTREGVTREAGGRETGGREAGSRGLPPDRREHFGTEEAALRRVRELLPAAEWIDLRLFGPDGRMIAGQHALEARLGLTRDPPEAGDGQPAPG